MDPRPVSSRSALNTRPRPLFLIGNKRSGTSHFVRLLNLHPEVFVSHESDIVWILYQWTRRQPFACYPWDGPVGMHATLAACGSLLPDAQRGDAPPDIAELFARIQLQLMTNGSAVQEPYREKTKLAWLGDKKPVQHADPAICAFIRHHFPEARFLHLTRHPRATVASMLKAGRSWAKVDYWSTSATDILDRWSVHERWVLAIKESAPEGVLTVRFEDLIASPGSEMRRVFEFLQLDVPGDVVQAATMLTSAAQNEKHAAFALPSHVDAEDIMRIYGYSPVA